MPYIIYQILLGWSIKKSEMSGAYVWGREHMEGQVVDGRIILKGIFKKWDGGMNRIYLAQDRVRWWGLANTKWNLRVGFHKMRGISCFCEKLLTSEAGVYSMEVVHTNSSCSLALSGVNRRWVHTMIRKDKRARIFRKIKIPHRVSIYWFLKAAVHRLMNVWSRRFGWEENLSARMSQTPTAPPSTIAGILTNYTRYARGYTKTQTNDFS